MLAPRLAKVVRRLILEKASGLIKDQPVASNEVSSNPFVSAETLKACALVGLHLLQGCPVSPEMDLLFGKRHLL